MGNDYSAETDDGDSLNSALKTPVATADEDRNATLQARAYYGDGESAYGYGQLNNGLGQGGDGSEMSAMTVALRQAVGRSRFDSSPNPSSRSHSRANSTATSLLSRRNSNTLDPDDGLSLKGLNISNPGKESCCEYKSKTSSESSEEKATEGAGQTSFDPNNLVFIQRLGEGTGGSVDLVKDPASGRIMAKKVSVTPHTVNLQPHADTIFSR